MEIRDFGRIGVLMGGPSSERDISLKSGNAVLSALKGAGADVLGIDIMSDNKENNIRLLDSYVLDCAFIALHGRFGEDGTIQDVLERMGIPYTGSGIEASRLAMDKIGSLALFKEGGLAVPESYSLSRDSYSPGMPVKNYLGFPVVVKPANHGSSIGLSIVEDEAPLATAIETAFRFDERVIVERYIPGRELTVGVLGEEPLPVIEIVPKHKFFDFEAKYHSGLTDYLVPAPLSPDVERKVRQAGLKAHKLLGCFGCSRTDIILDERDVPYILEINTIPGMTSTSLLPKAAAVLGMDFTSLCVNLLELAYEKTRV